MFSVTPFLAWLTSIATLVLLVLAIVACVSLIRLSVHVRSGGRRYVIHDSDDEEYDERPVPRRRMGRPTGL